MRKQNLFILCSILLGTLTSTQPQVANFTGHWIADSGKVSTTIGLSSECSKTEATHNLVP